MAEPGAVGPWFGPHSRYRTARARRSGSYPGGYGSSAVAAGAGRPLSWTCQRPLGAWRHGSHAGLASEGTAVA